MFCIDFPWVFGMCSLPFNVGVWFVVEGAVVLPLDVGSSFVFVIW